MSKELDKLFRDKLESYQKPAPASAWNKIEKELLQKDNKKALSFWLGIAASVSLITIATFLLWPKNHDASNQQHLAKHAEKPDKKSETTINKTDVLSGKSDLDTKQKENGGKVLTKKRKPADLKTKTAPTVAVTQVETQNKPVKDVLTIIDAIPDTATVDKIINEEIVTAQQDNSVTITYTAEEVNEKYLNKTTLAEATSRERKTSRLRRMLNKAHTLKNNQDPMGELRQKKNEILALNFSTDKRRQN